MATWRKFWLLLVWLLPVLAAGWTVYRAPAWQEPRALTVALEPGRSVVLGREGLRETSNMAVLNANYVQEKLRPHYDAAAPGYCMHECVFSGSRFGANGERICLDHSMIWTTRRVCGSTSTARLFTTV